MRRTVIAAAALAVAVAQYPLPVQAQDPGRFAVDACERSVGIEARKKYNVGRAQFLGRANLRQVSNAQTGVSGRGQLDTARGWVPFSYSCIYNYRSGKTGGISIKSAYSPRQSGGDDTGKIVGAIVGAAIAGAIISSIDKDKSGGGASHGSGWWSPAPNVSCNSYQSACYKGGRFNPHWTHKIYR